LQDNHKSARWYTHNDLTDEHDTKELLIEQERRVREEELRARESDTEEETKSHERCAEKSQYLREKLEERERSERE
jgi:hypothetical protein